MSWRQITVPVAHQCLRHGAASAAKPISIYMYTNQGMVACYAGICYLLACAILLHSTMLAYLPPCCPCCRSCCVCWVW